MVHLSLGLLVSALRCSMKVTFPVSLRSLFFSSILTAFPPPQGRHIPLLPLHALELRHKNEAGHLFLSVCPLKPLHMLTSKAVASSAASGLHHTDYECRLPVVWLHLQLSMYVKQRKLDCSSPQPFVDNCISYSGNVSSVTAQ